MAVQRKNQLLVRAAVMNSLARCSESSAPLCCLGEFLEQLTRLGWHRDDILSVERSVLVMLGKIKEKSLAVGLDPQKSKAGADRELPVDRTSDRPLSQHEQRG